MDLWPADDEVHCVARCQDYPAHDIVGMLCQDGAGRVFFRATVFAETLGQCDPNS